MKIRLFSLPILFAVAAVGLLAATAVWHVPGRSSTEASTLNPTLMTPTVIPTPEAEVMPLYPGAKLEQVDSSHQVANAKVIQFEVAANPLDVMSFYKDILVKKGWVLRSEVSLRQLGFTWADPAAILPWGLDIDMPITYSYNSERKAMTTWGTIYLRRVPDVHKIPFYPGGQQISVSKDHIEAGSNPDHKTYMVKATPPEIEAFYKNVLPQYGWILDEGTNDNITQGITYKFRLGSVSDLRGAYVTVSTKADEGTQTRVDIVANGNISDR